jgi:hypothetical protein
MSIKVGKEIGAFPFGVKKIPVHYAITQHSLKSGCTSVVRKSTKPGSDKWYYVSDKDKSQIIQKKVKKACPPVKATPVKKTTTRKKPRSSKFALSPTSSKAEIIGRMKLVRSIYHKKYAFPDWAIQAVSNNFDKLMKPVRVYYTNGDSLADVKKVATEREPVNITMVERYDAAKLKKAFGWSSAYYRRYFEQTGKLAPNIAVYTPTLVDYGGNTNTMVHILNSIGYAFDSKKQADYKYFMALPNRRAALFAAYLEVFRKIYKCARDLKLSTVVMSLVGANNFALHYADDEDKQETGIPSLQRHVWVPAFLQIWKENKDIQTVFMGSQNTRAFQLINQTAKFEDIGFFPDNISLVDPDKTLWVNAWDPLSLPGNGNSEDDSLDGFIGRVTNIAINGSGMTNPFMKFIPV